MKSEPKSLKLSIDIIKVTLLFIACFSTPLSYGVDERDYKNLSQSVARVSDPLNKSFGSGFFITENLLVTNDHIVRGVENITQWMEVIAPSSKRDYGRVLIADPESDLAIIKTRRSDYKPLSLGSQNNIIRGRRAFTIGYPSDVNWDEQVKGVTFKELSFLMDSSIRRGNKVVLVEGSIGMRIGNEAFHTIAFSSSGSSGSPVFSQDLKVIGIVYGSITSISTETISIPINKLKVLIEGNREFLEKESEMRLDHMSSEPVLKRALDADIKTVGDMFRLGVIYKAGIGSVLPDLQDSFYWFHRAARQSHAEAQYTVAVMYYYGEGVKRNFQKAHYWYEKAAKQSHAEAQYELGGIYYRGGHVKRDLQKAFGWLEGAAKQGHRNAQYELAMMYYQGLGVERDFQKALEWFKAAAGQGHPSTQYHFGKMYYHGETVSRDFQKARYWKRKNKQNRQCY